MESMLVTKLLIAVLPLASVTAAPPLATDAPAPAVEIASDRGPAQAAPAAGAIPGKPGGAILRCWQHGRLLFEEEVADGPDGARLRLRLNDRDRSTLHVLELNGALCTVRRTPPGSR